MIQPELSVLLTDETGLVIDANLGGSGILSVHVPNSPSVPASPPQVYRLAREVGVIIVPGIAVGNQYLQQWSRHADCYWYFRPVTLVRK